MADDGVLPPRFELIREVGAGGTGVVYEAHDQVLGRAVAVKVFHDRSPETFDRIKQEFRVAAAVRHPNLVRLGELFEHDGSLCFSMELVDGVDLGLLSDGTIRGLQLHTMHPLELTDMLNGWGPGGPGDVEGWEATLPEWDAFLEWSLANRQNRAHWVLLSAESWQEFADGAVRAVRTSTPVGVLRDLEGDALDGGPSLRVSPEALETVLTLTRRFFAHEAFPGKAVRLLKAVLAGPGELRDNQRWYARADVFAAGIILWELLAGRRLYKAAEGESLLQVARDQTRNRPEQGHHHHQEHRAGVCEFEHGTAVSELPTDGKKGPQHSWALSSINLRAGLVGSARSQRASDQERLARLRSFSVK